MTAVPIGRPGEGSPAGTSATLLTIEQAAAYLNMSPRYVRRLVAERRVAFHRLGRAVRISTGDLDAFTAAGRVEPLTAGDAWRSIRTAA